MKSTGFGPAKAYFLEYDGRLYDSKAVIGYAYGVSTGVPLRPEDFSGGVQRWRSGSGVADPDLVGRGNQAHKRIRNALAGHLKAHGMQPLDQAEAIETRIWRLARMAERASAQHAARPSLLRDSEPEVLLDGLRGISPLDLGSGSEISEDRNTSLSSSVTYSFAHLAGTTRRLLPATCLFSGIADSEVLAVFSDQPNVPGRSSIPVRSRCHRSATSRKFG